MIIKQKMFFNLILCTIVAIILSCNSNSQETLINEKTACFNSKLSILKSQKIYNDVMTQFIDTFKSLKDSIKIFGRSNVINNRIDESIFFNAKRNECLLIVLQKFTNKSLFGQVRIIRGKFYGERWVFKPSMVYTYDPDYSKKYEENDFNLISKLGRYSVLTEGMVDKEGCEIDEQYWFKLMPTD